MLSVSTASLNRLVDWFIPADIAADREALKQARMFLFSHLFGPFIGNTVPLALYLFDPAPGYQVAVLALSITGFWVFPFILRSWGRYNALVLLSVQNLIFCIMWSCYFYGGVTSPTLPWVLTIPLLAFFYVGSSQSLRASVLWLFGFNLIGFGGLYWLGKVPEPNMPFAALQGLGIVSTIAASLYVAMMALFYARVLASQSELESEMRGHLATAVELRRATEEAEAASVAKAEFLAKMSHELRTPLNAVIGYSQMLLEDASEEGDEESVSDLNKIHAAGQHLLKLVNEILDLSKIEAGKMELFIETIDVAATVESVVADFRRRAEAKGTALLTRVENGLGFMRGDADKIRQALSQIIDNAVKFTEGGTIRVHAARVDAPNGEHIQMTVRDTGIGIAQELQPRLFEQFTVGDDSSASKYGGTGLGLALSRKLARLMGGDITVESAAGRGSCFTLDVPVAPASDAPLGSEYVPASPVSNARGAREFSESDYFEPGFGAVVNA